VHYHYFTIEQRESLERQIRSQGAAEAAETLKRLHTPEYGLCQRCGADIPYVRLIDFPARLYCDSCESPK
jgi:RNA polymerase-binding transcription factor DksA